MGAKCYNCDMWPNLVKAGEIPCKCETTEKPKARSSSMECVRGCAEGHEHYGPCSSGDDRKPKAGSLSTASDTCKDCANHETLLCDKHRKAHRAGLSSTECARGCAEGHVRGCRCDECWRLV